MSLCVGSHLSRMLSPDLFSCSPCVCEYLGQGPRGIRGRAAPPPASSAWDAAGRTVGSGESARLPVLVCLINLRTGFLKVGSSRPLRSSRVAGKCSLRQMAEKRRVKPRGARGSAAGPIGGPLIRYYPGRPPERGGYSPPCPSPRNSSERLSGHPRSKPRGPGKTLCPDTIIFPPKL